MALLPVPRAEDEPELADWRPFAELGRLSRQMTRLFDGWFPFADLPDVFAPAADVEETDDAYTVEIELPGVRKGDVSVEASARRLVVRAERREAERKGILRRRGRARGRLHYEVTLPGEVDVEHIDAHLEDGVLTVRVPKTGRERPRRIAVS
jgi:HSP20 family protein